MNIWFYYQIHSEVHRHKEIGEQERREANESVIYSKYIWSITLNIYIWNMRYILKYKYIKCMGKDYILGTCESHLNNYILNKLNLILFLYIWDIYITNDINMIGMIILKTHKKRYVICPLNIYLAEGADIPPF